MSAVECLEHKWLSESSQPLKDATNDSTTNIIPTDAAVENLSQNDYKIDASKMRENNCENVVVAAAAAVATTAAAVTAAASPSKPNAGFFLHQTPKNGTALDEVLFSSLNNGFNTAANTNASKLNGIDHHHHHHHPHHLHNNNNNHHHNNHHHHHHHHPQSVECPKQNATVNNTTNLSCNINSNDTTDLLKDYATNKENINLSKILANRIAPMQNQSQTNQLINQRTSLHNNNTSSTNTYEYSDDTQSSNISSVLTTVQQTLAGNNTPPASTTKHETVLFPDAPTTPKVLRKSNQSEADTPSCVALVKQFQLNNGNLSNRIDYDEISVSDATTSSTPPYPQQSPNRSKFANLSSEHNRHEHVPSYRLSATAITTSTTNGHHSLGSSTLSINTLTESSVGVAQQHSNSTITMNCLCGADKTANCCCNSSSRTALNYRKKSLAAVVDSSILC